MPRSRVKKDVMEAENEGVHISGAASEIQQEIGEAG